MQCGRRYNSVFEKPVATTVGSGSSGKHSEESSYVHVYIYTGHLVLCKSEMQHFGGNNKVLLLNPGLWEYVEIAIITFS